MSEETPIVKVLLVFARVCETESGKPARLFYLVTRDEYERGESEFKEQRLFGPKVCKHATPGNVYEIEAKEASADTIFGSTARYIGMWKDDTKRLQWSAEHRMTENYKSAKKREQDAKKYDALKEQLAPLRDLYARTPYAKKQALLAAILYEITRG